MNANVNVMSVAPQGASSSSAKSSVNPVQSATKAQGSNSRGAQNSPFDNTLRSLQQDDADKQLQGQKATTAQSAKADDVTDDDDDATTSDDASTTKAALALAVNAMQIPVLNQETPAQAGQMQSQSMDSAPTQGNGLQIPATTASANASAPLEALLQTKTLSQNANQALLANLAKANGSQVASSSLANPNADATSQGLSLTPASLEALLANKEVLQNANAQVQSTVTVSPNALDSLLPSQNGTATLPLVHAASVLLQGQSATTPTQQVTANVMNATSDKPLASLLANFSLTGQDNAGAQNQGQGDNASFMGNNSANALITPVVLPSHGSKTDTVSNPFQAIMEHGSGRQDVPAVPLQHHVVSQVMNPQALLQPLQGQVAETQDVPRAQEDYGVPKQIVEQARLLRLPGNTEMVIKLTPEHLGELTLRVSVSSAGAVNASFHSDNVVVRNIIETSMVQLKHDLQAQGLKVENVGVYAGLSDGMLPNGQQGDGSAAYYGQGNHGQQAPSFSRNAQEGLEALEDHAVPELTPITNAPSSLTADGVDYRV